MKKLIFIAAVMAATLASCQKKEAVNSAVSASEKEGAISFSTYSQQTKASVATLDTLKKNSFGVFGIENMPDESGNPTTWAPGLSADFFQDGLQKVEYDLGEGRWRYTPVKYWSDDDKVTMDFIAFSPWADYVSYTPGDEDNGAILGPFSINQDIAQQTDYLVATKFDLPQVQKIVLEYEHALARIGFSAYSPAMEGDNYIIIDTVQLCDRTTEDRSNPAGFFRTEGSISLTRAEQSTGGYKYSRQWVPSGSDKYAFTLVSDDMENGGRISQTPTRLNKTDKYIMVIPQNSLGNLQIYISYTVHRDGSDERKSKIFECPVSAFNMGTAYTFNFNLGVSAVEFDCMVDAWNEKVYSLNASGDVYASSSREDCAVYVNAQRQANNAVKYELYAETKTVREDNDSVRMLPVWKLLNKAYEEEPFIHYNDLVNVYLGWEELPGTELYETTIDKTKYTVLSFTIDESTKAALATSYYAVYTEDPISAYVYYKDSQIKNSVEVSRIYTAPEKFSFKVPYVSTVTLTPTNRPSAPFVKWQGSADGGKTWMDIETDSNSDFILGEGYSLTFEEENVFYWEQYTSQKFIFRAVFGTIEEGVAIYKGKNIIECEPANIPSTGEDPVYFKKKTQVKLTADGPKSGETLIFRYKDVSSSTWVEISETDPSYSIKKRSDEAYDLIFDLASKHNGKVFDAYYKTEVQVTSTMESTTSTGKSLSYETKKYKEDGYDVIDYIFPRSAFSALAPDSVLVYNANSEFGYPTTGNKWVKAPQVTKVSIDDKTETNWTVHIMLLPENLKNINMTEYIFMMDDGLGASNKSAVRIKLPAAPASESWRYVKISGETKDTTEIASQITMATFSPGDTLVVEDYKAKATKTFNYNFDKYEGPSIRVLGGDSGAGDIPMAPVGIVQELEAVLE